MSKLNGKTKCSVLLIPVCPIPFVTHSKRFRVSSTRGAWSLLVAVEQPGSSSTASCMAYAQPFPLAQNQSAAKAAFAPDLSVRLVCPDCRDPNPNIVEEFSSGDLVCGGCGLVLGDRVVDTRSECKCCLVRPDNTFLTRDISQGGYA
jgi:hypothetical protein